MLHKMSGMSIVHVFWLCTESFANSSTHFLSIFRSLKYQGLMGPYFRAKWNSRKKSYTTSHSLTAGQFIAKGAQNTSPGTKGMSSGNPGGWLSHCISRFLNSYRIRNDAYIIHTMSLHKTPATLWKPFFHTHLSDEIYGVRSCTSIDYSGATRAAINL